jgi:hypothetical protein
MTKPTPRQRDLLRVLLDAPTNGLPPGEIAFRCGYDGRKQPGGGYGRAPMWTGRMLANMPSHWFNIKYERRRTMIKLSFIGEQIAKDA